MRRPVDEAELALSEERLALRLRRYAADVAALRERKGFLEARVSWSGLRRAWLAGQAQRVCAPAAAHLAGGLCRDRPRNKHQDQASRPEATRNRCLTRCCRPAQAPVASDAEWAAAAEGTTERLRALLGGSAAFQQAFDVGRAAPWGRWDPFHKGRARGRPPG